MCFLPRRALNVAECEIARAYKITTTSSAGSIEPIAFVVPRKADSFQSDIFPPAPSLEPSLSAPEFFSSKKDIVRRVVDLDTGATSGFTPLTVVPPSTSSYYPSSSEPPSAITPSLASTPPKAAPLGASTFSSSFSPRTPTFATGIGGQTFSSAFKATPAQEYSADNDVSQARALNLPC